MGVLQLIIIFIQAYTNVTIKSKFATRRKEASMQEA